MNEYFVVANSFAAPFVSDASHGFVHGETPEQALLTFVSAYTHPAGLFSALLYDSSDSYHKNRPPLAKWLCNQEIAMKAATVGKGSYTCNCHLGYFEIDGERHVVNDPKGGSLVPV